MRIRASAAASAGACGSSNRAAAGADAQITVVTDGSRSVAFTAQPNSKATPRAQPLVQPIDHLAHPAGWRRQLPRGARLAEQRRGGEFRRRRRVDALQRRRQRPHRCWRAEHGSPRPPRSPWCAASPASNPGPAKARRRAGRLEGSAANVSRGRSGRCRRLLASRAKQGGRPTASNRAPVRGSRIRARRSRPGPPARESSGSARPAANGLRARAPARRRRPVPRGRETGQSGADDVNRWHRSLPASNDVCIEPSVHRLTLASAHRAFRCIDAHILRCRIVRCTDPSMHVTPECISHRS